MTVGMHAAPFNRLVGRMEEIATQTEERVFLQIGTATPPPSNGEYARFLPERDFDEVFDTARVVVSHAGVGTILKAAMSQKPIVCVPRLRRSGEVWDDHQLEICRELSARSGLAYFTNVGDLGLEELNSALPLALSEAGGQLGDRILSFLDTKSSLGVSSG